ncbi:MAG TPA: glycosyltransferase [Candidatus Bathyarchaeia archaeon]|nr:glycosyltransferase [Candidatus Bathyarchaeia archaeon]
MIDLLFFSSPIGLGHATRDIAVSQYLGSFSKRFVSGEGASKLLSQNGFEVEDLLRPPSFQVENGKLQNPLKWLFKYYSYYNECKTISSKVLEKEKPRILVSDEDFASLVIAQKMRIRTILLTDILKTRFAKGIGSLVEKKMNQVMQKIIKKCDLVIIPENGKNHGNIIRVDPIVRELSQSRIELRKKFAFTRKTIVVSVGGTSSGKFLLEIVIETFKKIHLDADLIIVSGPAIQLPQTVIRNFGFVNNLHEIIFASDLVISLAGKSTIDESKHYGTPGIFIPIKGHFEQEENAKGLGFTYDDIFRLDDLILEKINEERNPQQYQGAKQAAELIRKFL